MSSELKGFKSTIFKKITFIVNFFFYENFTNFLILLFRTHVKQLYAISANGQPHAVAYGHRATLRLFWLRLVQPQPVQMRPVNRTGLLDKH